MTLPKPRPRYYHVWEDGYQAGLEDATDALREFLNSGGEFGHPNWEDDIPARLSGGAIVLVRSVIALRKWRPGAPWFRP